MTSLKRRPWTNGLAAAVIAVVGLATLTLPPRQAQAQVSVGIGFGVPGVWGYYAPPTYYYPYARITVTNIRIIMGIPTPTRRVFISDRPFIITRTAVGTITGVERPRAV